ncbi:GNAT family N-acetyltransferase [Albirhodobacter sp. R86504]|jgi:phosphinothricin acetyltransferase|uniref:GNAT family N-acetyltransferase n=1 Tax=Albirhodobacter sp. R86504 TaxID=3093848 RepID=UPI00366CD80B
MELRAANAADAAGITLIYNDAVTNTTAIWNDFTVDAANRIAWMADREAQGFPVLVAMEAGEVLGYASYGTWRAIDGFRRTVEHSVYVSAQARGRGVGVALMEALIAEAKTRGVHVMVAAIDASNAVSIRLHERLGFRQTGVMPQVGMKFGRWLDLAFLQLQLDDAPNP